MIPDNFSEIETNQKLNFMHSLLDKELDTFNLSL